MESAVMMIFSFSILIICFLSFLFWLGAYQFYQTFKELIHGFMYFIYFPISIYFIDFYLLFPFYNVLYAYFAFPFYQYFLISKFNSFLTLLVL